MDGGWTNPTFILETKSKRDSPPCTLIPPGLQSTAGPALLSWGQRSQLCSGQCWPCQAAASFLIWKGQRRGGPVPSARLSEPPHGPAPLSGSTDCVLLSRFCQILPSVDNHQPLFAAESFLTLPGLPTTRLWLWFSEGSGGQKVGGTFMRVTGGKGGGLTLHFGTLPQAPKFPKKFALCPLCTFDTFWKFSQASNTAEASGE